MENKDKNISRREARRKALINLSQQARALRDEHEQIAHLTINDILIRHFYMDDEHDEFKRLSEWNKEGFQVKKGARAFTVWGKKRNGFKAAEQEGEEDQEYRFFPLAYLFSNAQVERQVARPAKRKEVVPEAAELSSADF